MSTNHVDEGKGILQQIPVTPPLGEQETVKFAPGQTSMPPRLPPTPPRRSTKKRWYIGATIVALLVLILGGLFALAQFGKTPSTTTVTTKTATPGSKVTVTATPSKSDLTPAPAPGIILGPQACPAQVASLAYWNKLIGTNNGQRHVESVSCANIMNSPALQTLVTVRSTGIGTALDVYVYNHITSATPTRIFALEHLAKGDAKISGYNTIMTAEADMNSSLNAGKPVVATKVDLFREFDWSDGAGALVQTAFPGIFPDLTRYQAEKDQQAINQGQQTWKNDPAQVAQALAKHFFNWTRTLSTQVRSGGGAHDVGAVVRVQERSLVGSRPGPFVDVTLSRLEGNTHNFWVVTAVDGNPTITLTNLVSRTLITSPLTLEGNGSAFEGVIGRAAVYDHLYAEVGHARIIGANGMGTVPYSTDVSYTVTFPQGYQEGLVAVYASSGGLSDETAGAVITKVLINPSSGVTYGTQACPKALSDPAYWNKLISTPSNPVAAEHVYCANLKINWTLQAVVVGREITGGGPTFRSVFVFDKLASAHPTLIFSSRHLLHGDAQISPVNTLLIAQADPNSFLNSGKSDANLVLDVSQEYSWFGSSHNFAIVTFPGIFPDLTRYQAEQSQQAVNQGHQPWKRDPVMVAQTLATGLLKWSLNSQATLVSGGGPHDIDAMLSITSTGPNHPIVNMTLARLDQNTHNIWEVTGIDNSVQQMISNPLADTIVSSPLAITGSGSAFEGDVGTVYLYDRFYNVIGQARCVPATGNGYTTFTVTLTYKSSYPAGIQQGILAYYTRSQADGAISGVVMLRVLIR